MLFISERNKCHFSYTFALVYTLLSTDTSRERNKMNVLEHHCALTSFTSCFLHQRYQEGDDSWVWLVYSHCYVLHSRFLLFVSGRPVFYFRFPQPSALLLSHHPLPVCMCLIQLPFISLQYCQICAFHSVIVENLPGLILFISSALICFITV